MYSQAAAGSPQAAGFAASAPPQPIYFCVDPQKLDADAELRRLFGKAVVRRLFLSFNRRSHVCRSRANALKANRPWLRGPSPSNQTLFFIVF
jgi:hypothetical protein